MLKKLPIIAFSLMFLLTPSLSFAQNAPQPTTDTAVSNTPITPKQTLKNELSSLKNDISEKRAQFKQELATLKDQRKKLILERIDTRLNNINKERTTKMTQRLDRMSSILDKISSKEAELKSQNKNTTTLLGDITIAKNTIATARDAVTNQSEKDYVVNIADTTALRADAKTTVLQYRTDIKNVFLSVEEARKATLTAFINEKTLQEGTLSTTKTNQSTVPTGATTP